MLRREAIRAEHGQTLILFVVALPLFLALIALVTDGSNLFANKRSVQNVADATVLAVVRDLPPDGTACLGTCLTTLQSDAIKYSDLNNGPTVDHACASSADVNCYQTPYKDNSSVQIRVKRQVSTFFGGVTGLFSSSVVASAAAGLGGVPSAAGNVSPLGLASNLWSPSLLTGPTDCATNIADCYKLDFDASGFALFDLSNTSTTAPIPASTSCNRAPGSAPTGGFGMNRDIAFGYPGDGSSVLLPSNAWYCGNNGNKNGLKNGVDYAYGPATHVILMVPVFDPTKTVTITSGGNSNTSYFVVGFAAFSIDQPPPNWNNNTHYVLGHFTTFIATGVSGGPPGGPNDFGVHVITLNE